MRNKFLIKHTEKTIKDIEKEFDEDTPQVFMMEEKATEVIRQSDKKKLYFSWQLSTSQLYNLFYVRFLTEKWKCVFRSDE